MMLMTCLYYSYTKEASSSAWNNRVIADIFIMRRSNMPMHGCIKMDDGWTDKTRGDVCFESVYYNKTTSVIYPAVPVSKHHFEYIFICEDLYRYKSLGKYPEGREQGFSGIGRKDWFVSEVMYVYSRMRLNIFHLVCFLSVCIAEESLEKVFGWLCEEITFFCSFLMKKKTS